MIPLGTYELADFPWLKRLSFLALLVNAFCFVLLCFKWWRHPSPKVRAVSPRLLVAANVVAAVVLYNVAPASYRLTFLLGVIAICWGMALRSFRLMRESRRKADRCTRATHLLGKGLANLSVEETKELRDTLVWLYEETGQDCFRELLEGDRK